MLEQGQTPAPYLNSQGRNWVQFYTLPYSQHKPVIRLLIYDECHVSVPQGC